MKISDLDSIMVITLRVAMSCNDPSSPFNSEYEVTLGYGDDESASQAAIADVLDLATAMEERRVFGWMQTQCALGPAGAGEFRPYSYTREGMYTKIPTDPGFSERDAEELLLFRNVHPTIEIDGFEATSKKTVAPG